MGHGLSCSEACGVFADQGLKPCLLHWQEDSLPPSRQGRPAFILLVVFFDAQNFKNFHEIQFVFFFSSVAHVLVSWLRNHC